MSVSTDQFYLTKEEPVKSTLLAMKTIILQQHPDITHVLKYGMPFFCYRQKMFCYLWIHKKFRNPYLGIVEGSYFNESFLLAEKRSRMKIMLLDPTADLPIEAIKALIQKAIGLYQNGTIHIR